MNANTKMKPKELKEILRQEGYCISYEMVNKVLKAARQITKTQGKRFWLEQFKRNEEMLTAQALGYLKSLRERDQLPPYHVGIVVKLNFPSGRKYAGKDFVLR